MERRCPLNRRCGQQNRIVMVRKVDQRTFATTQGQETKYEEKTTETVETFNCGNKPDRRVTLHGKRSVAPPFSASAPGSSRGSPPDLRRASSASALHNQNDRLNKIEGQSRKIINEKSNSSNHLNKSLVNTSQRSANNFTASNTRGTITCKASITDQQNSVKANVKASLTSTYYTPRGNTAVQKKSPNYKMSNDANGGFTDFQKECLLAHNKYRLLHGVPKLKLNKRLCNMSSDWANHLVSIKRVEHSNNPDTGENIYSVWSSNANHVVNGGDAVEKWYSEIKHHPFGREPSSLKSGHFTQVVWMDTREIGVAMARSEDGNCYVVVSYSPPGNYIGNFTNNVPPPL